jgi:hypothetical protein
VTQFVLLDSVNLACHMKLLNRVHGYLFMTYETIFNYFYCLKAVCNQFNEMSATHSSISVNDIFENEKKSFFKYSTKRHNISKLRIGPIL